MNKTALSARSQCWILQEFCSCTNSDKQKETGQSHKTNLNYDFENYCEIVWNLINCSLNDEIGKNIHKSDEIL